MGDDDDDTDDESRKKKGSDLMDKANDDDKVMEEVEKEIDVQDITPPWESQPIQHVVTSTSSGVTPSHSFIPTSSQEEIKFIFLHKL